MAFMQPQIYRAEYFKVDTSMGTEIVPCDVVRLPFAVNFAAGGVFTEDSSGWQHLVRALAPYVEGSEIYSVCPESGYLARLSAPGYMDCTDWSDHATEDEAREYLREMYGDDDSDDLETEGE